MAFGQPQGPPATYRQLQELQALLERAGHTDFRDARGPMGFTQRQAGGKFTRDEAEAFIAQLQEAEHRRDTETTPEPPAGGNPQARGASGRRAAPSALDRFSDQQLAAELQRRGWIVVEP